MEAVEMNGGDHITTNMEFKKRIVICGGGVMGASIAYHLAMKGVTSLVVEKCQVACAASGKAGGFLASNWCARFKSKGYSEFEQKSFEIHKQLADTLGKEYDYKYRTVDTLGIYASEAKRKKKRNTPSSELPPWCASENIVSVDVMGTTSTTAQLHPKLFTEALMNAAIKRGAQLKIGTVEGVVTEEGKVKGVKVDGEVIEADVVVIAMGPWSATVATKWFPEGAIPKQDTQFKMHNIKLTTSPLTAHCLFVNYQFANSKETFPTVEFYPRVDGELIVSGQEEETEVPDDPRDVTPDKETCDMLYLIAKKMVPILKEHEVEEKRACIPPHSDDLLPVMGEIPGVEGAYICSGHHVWGISHSAASGAGMAELIVDGKCKLFDMSVFNPSRFQLKREENNKKRKLNE